MVRSLDMHGHWINSIALSSDHVMRNSPPTESEAKLTPAQRYAKATGGEEERMVSCSDDHTLCLWLPCSSKKPVARMTGHMQPVNHVAFSPDGSMIASASFDKSVKIWDGRTGSRAFSIALGACCSAFTRVPVNRHPVLAQQSAAPAQFSDTLPPPPATSGKFLGSCFGHVGAVYQVAWSSDSRLLVSASKDSTVKVWDAKTRKLAMDLPGHADEVQPVFPL
jgi:ribosome assembly protein 4